jgi:hypothetical protein
MIAMPERHPDGARAMATLQGLAAGAPLWGVVEGAHDDRIAHWIRSGDAPWACLYAGQIPDELVEVAPYAVRIRAGHPGSLRLLEHGWAKNWGIFVTTTVTLAELRRHLRRFLRVATEDGRRLIFRFHDPRVLRLYLPTCTAAELEQFFGPMNAIHLQTPSADGFEVCTLRDRKLQVERVVLQGAP